MENKLRKIMLLCSLLLLGGQWVQAQELEWSIAPSGLNMTLSPNYTELIEADDWGNVYNIEADSIAKYSPNGHLLWKVPTNNTYPPIRNNASSENRAIEIDQQGNIYTSFCPSFEDSHFSVTKRNNSGTIQWRKQWLSMVDGLGYPYDNITISDMSTDPMGNTYILGTYNSNNFDFDPNNGITTLTRTNNGSYRESFLLKLNTNGNLVWVRNIPFEFSVPSPSGLLYEPQLETTSDNQALYMSGLHNGANIVAKYDSTGTFLWQQRLDGGSNGNLDMYDLATDYNGDVLIGGSCTRSSPLNPSFNVPAIPNYPASYYGYIIKLNSNNGSLSWWRYVNGVASETWAIGVDKQNNIYEAGPIRSSTIIDPNNILFVLPPPSGFRTYLRKFDSNGNLLKTNIVTDAVPYHITFNNSGAAYMTASVGNNSSFHSPVGVSSSVLSGNVLIKFLVEPLHITGNIYHDQNNDCSNNNERGVGNIVVMAANAQDTFYSNTDTTGNYSIAVRSGTYNITALPQSPYWLSICNPVQTASVDSINRTANNIDFGLQALANCPYMSVEIGTPLVRNTTNNTYTINYCNDGTVSASNPYVEISFDTSLLYNSSSIPLVSQNGNTYTFDLGSNLSPGQCGQFTVVFRTIPSTPLGQSICTEAHIYPDSLCNSNWTGPIIQASATCQLDTVFFQLKNNGTNMLSPLNYSIFEDHVMLRTAPFTLGSNGSTTIAQAAAPGKTYRIEAQQPASIPPYVAPPIAHSTVVGCNALNGTILTTGIIPQFYTGNTVPWIDIDCQTVIGSFDPNDKTPQPLGYDTAHYIERGTPLDYKIRFQNTGIDTAFNIVIVDTLSPHLDITTFQMKGSSHPYTWQLSQQGILTVSYLNIRLVDSFTNEPLSHGFFSYEIQQKPNLPLGTEILNFADIYFDYNAPIRTNTTFHTIGENYVARVLLTTDKLIDEKLSIQAFPNPFDQQTTIQVEGKVFETLTLRVADIAGRVVYTQQVNNQSKILLQGEQLHQGVYFYTLEGDGKFIGGGKLIAQ